MIPRRWRCLLPIERYYAVADKVLNKFNAAYENCGGGDSAALNDAYVFGKRFATFSFDGLPHHEYYQLKKTDIAAMRKKNRRDASKVISLLEDVVKLMDEDELKIMRINQERFQRENEEKRARLLREAKDREKSFAMKK